MIKTNPDYARVMRAQERKSREDGRVWAQQQIDNGSTKREIMVGLYKRVIFTHLSYAAKQVFIKQGVFTDDEYNKFYEEYNNRNKKEKQ